MTLKDIKEQLKNLFKEEDDENDHCDDCNKEEGDEEE